VYSTARKGDYFEGVSYTTGVSHGKLLWVLAAIFVVAGIVAVVRGEVLFGIALIVIGLLIGPGGVSIFT